MEKIRTFIRKKLFHPKTSKTNMYFKNIPEFFSLKMFCPRNFGKTLNFEGNKIL